MKEDDRLIYLMTMAQQSLMRYTNTALVKSGLRVTAAQTSTLFLLKEKKQCMMSEISQAFGIDNSAVTRLVDRLEKSGLVERQIPPDNRRAILIRMTPEGLTVEKKAAKIIKAVNDRILMTFSREDIAAYKRVLSDIRDKFGGRDSGGNE